MFTKEYSDTKAKEKLEVLLYQPGLQDTGDLEAGAADARACGGETAEARRNSAKAHPALAHVAGSRERAFNAHSEGWCNRPHSNTPAVYHPFRPNNGVEIANMQIVLHLGE